MTADTEPDLSQGEIEPIRLKELADALQDEARLRCLQNFVFGGAYLVVAVAVIGVFVWIFCIDHRPAPYADVKYAWLHFLSPLIAMTSIAIVFGVALMRFAFRPKAPEKDESDEYSAFVALLKAAQSVFGKGKD